VRVRACQQPTTGISHGIYSEKKTVVKENVSLSHITIFFLQH